MVVKINSVVFRVPIFVKKNFFAFLIVIFALGLNPKMQEAICHYPLPALLKKVTTGSDLMLVGFARRNR
jgi:hypothetical protein